MNIVLFHPDEIRDEGHALIGGLRARHLIDVLGVAPQRELRCGLLNGSRGHARVTRVDAGFVALDYTLDGSALPQASLALVLAMPRPKVLRRVLESLSSLGIAELHLVRAAKVDKSYLDSSFLDSDRLREALWKGAELAGETRLAKVHAHPLFRPFVEDELPELVGGRAAWCVHPGPTQLRSPAVNEPTMLAIGPEGGWTEFEVDLFEGAGLGARGLGPRILRVETAIAFAAGLCAASDR